MRFAADKSNLRSSSNPVCLDRAPRYGRACERVMRPAGVLDKNLDKKSRCVSSAIAFAVTGPTSFVLPIALPRCRRPASGTPLQARWRAGFWRRKDRSPPAWGRPGTTRSGGVLLAPLPEQRKGGLHARVKLIIGVG